MNLKYFVNKMKDVSFSDCLSFFKLLVAILAMPFVKKQYAHCWVVCETPFEARDNGFHFFKHVKDHHPEIDCYYAISFDSPDYEKVAPYGNIIRFGSLKHWFLYLCADFNISSQKGGKPNAAVCAFLELLNLIDSRFVFLQHGIIINDVSWAHSDTTQLRYFITSTNQEYNYVKDTFGYKSEKVVLTGMPRLDNLHGFCVENNYILIMPTWRSRFLLRSERQLSDNDFVSSIYKRSWEDFLNSVELSNMIEQFNLKVVFFPHRNMQPFLKQFTVPNNIIVANWEDYDIQEELKKASILITDYSSVFFDMIYMKKPVIFYQFDYDEFRKYDYARGYFDYRNNCFSAWCDNVPRLCVILEKSIKNHYQITDLFLEGHKNTFPYYDRLNSERIVQLLMSQGE